MNFFFSNSEITSNSKNSDEIVISDGEDSELQNNEPEVLIVNESSETVVNVEQTEQLSEPLIDHVADNDSSAEVLIMEEEMAVDLSITSKNNNSEGKYFFILRPVDKLKVKPNEWFKSSF